MVLKLNYLNCFVAARKELDCRTEFLWRGGCGLWIVLFRHPACLLKSCNAQTPFLKHVIRVPVGVVCAFALFRCYLCFASVSAVWLLMLVAHSSVTLAAIAQI